MCGDKLTEKQHKIALAEIDEMFAREHQIIRRKHFRVQPNVAERAYRRGFVHGLVMVIRDLIADCVSLEEAKGRLAMALEEAEKIRYKPSHVVYFDSLLGEMLRRRYHRRTTHARR